jgi:hypothetical protein
MKTYVAPLRLTYLGGRLPIVCLFEATLWATHISFLRNLEQTKCSDLILKNDDSNKRRRTLETRDNKDTKDIRDEETKGT